MPGREEKESSMRTCTLTAMVLLVGLSLPLSAWGREAGDLVARYDALFQSADKPIAPSDEYGGTLAWGESYLLVSLIEMAEATGDPKYLDSFARRFDAALALRDSALGRRDVFSHRSLPVWGSVHYSKGQYHDWLVHTGMVTYPAAEFVRTVRGKPALARYRTKADAYLRACEEAVAAHDPEWFNGPAAGEGYYWDLYLRAHLPLNQQNALGRTLVTLWLVTGKPAYRDKAQRLARFFKNRLRAQPDGAYDWAYWPGLFDTGKGSEDISHAAINADFAALCARHGIVFSEEDMKRFARTFTEHIHLGDGKFALSVGGGASADASYASQAPRWLTLTPWDPKVWQIVSAFEESQGGPKDLLTISSLLRWRAGGVG